MAATDRLFLNALVASPRSLELRTIGFSSENLEALLDEHPAAITLSRAGMLAPERLLQAWEEQADVVFTQAGVSPNAVTHFCVFEAKTSVSREFEFKEVVNPKQLKAKFRDLASQYVLFTAAVWVIVPELRITSKRAPEGWRALLRAVFAHSWAAEMARSVTHNEAESDREVLLRERQRMLNAVGTYSSEDLATAAGSATSNASQFAADQRSAGRLFGVRFGQAWHYPKFQFDNKRRVLDDMKTVLQALSPDDQGWDRLQWFLQPHEKLGGRVPLEVWKTDRHKVIEAANTERWDGRD